MMEKKQKQKMEMEKKQKQNLPREIISEILKELPVKSLLRFSAVSKLWCSIIKDPSFVHAHHFRSHTRPGGFNILSFSSEIDGSLPRLYSTNLEGGIVSYINQRLPYQPKGRFESVNGLLCMENCIWNPSTRQRITLPPIRRNIMTETTRAHHSVSFDAGYFLGFDPTTGKHKILNICQIGDNTSSEKSRIECNILTLGTNLWRKIKEVQIRVDDPFDAFDFICSCSVAGVIYILAKIEPNNKEVIVAFEVGPEKFQILPPPREIRLRDGGIGSHCFPIKVGEQLALIDKESQTIWILEDYKNEIWRGGESIDNENDIWRKNRIAFPRSSRLVSSIPLGSIHTSEILFNTYPSNLSCYDLQSRALTTVHQLPKHRRYTMHVESLVRLERM